MARHLYPRHCKSFQLGDHIPCFGRTLALFTDNYKALCPWCSVRHLWIWIFPQQTKTPISRQWHSCRYNGSVTILHCVLHVPSSWHGGGINHRTSFVKQISGVITHIIPKPHLYSCVRARAHTHKHAHSDKFIWSKHFSLPKNPKKIFFYEVQNIQLINDKSV